MPGGTCCPTGAAWAQDHCAAVGPPECAATATDCAPRWCFGGQSADGADCALTAPDCLPVPHTCTDAELAAKAGCPVGTAPGLGFGCVAAGAALSAAATAASDAVPALPPAQPPRVCYDPGGDEPRPCASGEMGCRADEVLDAKGNCVLNVGTDLVCPAGFLPGAPLSAGGLPACAPDPAACGSDQYGGIAQVKGTVFVDASFGGKPKGTRASPFADLAAAAAALPDGGTIAVAAGSYSDSLLPKVPLDVRGRCAALVTLAPATKQPALSVSTTAANGTRLSGVTITGGESVLRASDGAKLLVHGVRIANTTSRALLASAGGSIAFSDGVVTDVLGASNLSTAGNAVTAEDDGSHVALLRVRISRAAGSALMARYGATASVTDVVIDDGNPTAQVNGLGTGINAFKGGQIVVYRVRVSLTIGHALSAEEESSSLTGSRVWADRCAAKQTGAPGGYGLLVSKGASAALAGLRTSGCRSAAVNVYGPGTTLQLTASALTGTRSHIPASSDGGGLVVAGGAKAQISSVWLSDNRAVGIAVTSAGTSLTAIDCVVHGTGAHDLHKGQGYGASVITGAHADFRRVRFSANRGSGVFVADKSSRLVGFDLVCDRTGPDQLPLPSGAGLYVQGEATVRMRGVRMSHSTTFGAVAAGAADVQLASLLIEDTLEEPASKDYGLGLVVLQGARVRLMGGRIHAAHGAGVAASDAGTSVAAHGLAVTDTLVRLADGGGGHGIYAAQGAELLLFGALLAGNRSTGVAADHAALTMDRAVVIDTQFAPLVNPDLTLGQQLADGVVAASATHLTLQRLIVANNARAGVLVNATPSGSLQRSVVSGGSFGVVTQQGTTLQKVDVAAYGASQQNRSGDAGLAIPPPPKLVTTK